MKTFTWIKNYLGEKFYPYTHTDAVYVDDTVSKNLTETLHKMNEKINGIQGTGNTHGHNNIDILNSITENTLEKMRSSYEHISDVDKHIPAGGSDGQIIGKKNGSIGWIDQPTNTGDETGIIPTKLSQLENDTGFITETSIDGKVDKIEGKELSSNDFTNENKLKLDGIPKFIFSTEVPTTLEENSICFVYEENVEENN